MEANLIDGWHDLPYGGGVLIEDGLPVRVSDSATNDEDGVSEKDIKRGLGQFGFSTWRIGDWSTAYGEPDCTAPLVLDE